MSILSLLLQKRDVAGSQFGQLHIHTHIPKVLPVCSVAESCRSGCGHVPASVPLVHRWGGKGVWWWGFERLLKQFGACW